MISSMMRKGLDVSNVVDSSWGLGFRGNKRKMWTSK